MNREFWKTFNKASPIDFRLLLYGVVVGIISGSFRLGDSIDEATAQGITAMIHITVGIWLGLKLCHFALLPVEKGVDSLVGRVTTLASRLGLRDSTEQTSQPQSLAKSAWLTIVRSCVFMAPLGAVFMTSMAVAIGIELRTGLSGTIPYVFWVALWSGALVSSLSIGIQYAYLWNAGRELAGLEQRLDSVDSIDGFTWNTSKLGRTFSNTHSFWYKLTGQRLTTLRGNPDILQP